MYYASRLAKSVKTPNVLVGGLRSRETMEDVLNDTDIELLFEPDFPSKLMNDENAVSIAFKKNNCKSLACRNAHDCVIVLDIRQYFCGNFV